MKEYDFLNEDEKDRVRILCQKLFHDNYITEFVFSGDNMKKSNPDYNDISTRFEIFNVLLGAVGWQLHENRSEGVIYVTSDYRSKPVLNKLETQFLYALRIIYDNRRRCVGNTNQIYISVRDITEQLAALDAVDGISKKDRKLALNTLKNKNIIAKIDGDLSELDSKIVILPSIMCVLSSAKIKLLTEQFVDNKESEDTKDDKVQ